MKLWWRNSGGDPLNANLTGASNAGGLRKARFSTNISLFRLSLHITGVVNPVRPSQIVDNTERCILFTAFDRVTVAAADRDDN